MGVGRTTAEMLARTVADRVAEGERLMLARIARNLAKGIEGPHWAQQKLAELRAYQGETRALVAELRSDLQLNVRAAMADAYKLGGAAGVRDIKRLISQPETVVGTPTGIRAVEKVSLDVLGKLDATLPRILRVTNDAYKQAVAAGVDQVLLGTQTRIQATQSVLDNLAQRGITGFIDKSGRGWDLTNYAEMAVRTGTMNAAVAGHVDTMQANGLDLVIVSSDGSPCPACSDWEGQVLSSSGDDANYPALQDAIDDGLMHPNCRHTVSAYQPGITNLPEPLSDDDQAAQAQRYQDSQKLRGIERDIRQAKRMQAVALDDAAQQDAAAQVAALQAKARSFTANTGQTRQYAREQIGKAH